MDYGDWLAWKLFKLARWGNLEVLLNFQNVGETAFAEQYFLFFVVLRVFFFVKFEAGEVFVVLASNYEKDHSFTLIYSRLTAFFKCKRESYLELLWTAGHAREIHMLEGVLLQFSLVTQNLTLAHLDAPVEDDEPVEIVLQVFFVY